MTEQRRSPGRPKGSKNKSIAVRTEALRESLSPDKMKEIGYELALMALDREAPYSDRIKAMTLALRYGAHSADVELMAETEENSGPSAEQMIKALRMIDALKEKTDDDTSH